MYMQEEKTLFSHWLNPNLRIDLCAAAYTGLRRTVFRSAQKRRLAYLTLRVRALNSAWRQRQGVAN